MKLARLGPAGRERPVVIVDQVHYDLTPITSDIDGAFLASGGVERARAALQDGTLAPIEQPESLRVGAPIARPGAVFCIGMNYAAHALESGSAPPTVPVLFLKVPNTVVGPNDEVTIPRGSHKTDWEVELGVVIGRQASYLDSPEQALHHIAGFVAANDLSERTFQLEVSGGQWSKGKISPGFSRSGRGWSPRMRSIIRTCGCEAGSTASPDRTPPPRTRSSMSRRSFTT